MAKRVRHVWFQCRRAGEKLDKERSFINNMLSLRTTKRCCACNATCDTNRARPVENEEGVGSTPLGRIPPKMVVVER